MKSCRTCGKYSPSYGYRNGKFVGLYISCDMDVKYEKECKKNNFDQWVKPKDSK